MKARIALEALIPKCPQAGFYSAKIGDVTIHSSPGDRNQAGLWHVARDSHSDWPARSLLCVGNPAMRRDDDQLDLLLGRRASFGALTTSDRNVFRFWML